MWHTALHISYVSRVRQSARFSHTSHTSLFLVRMLPLSLAQASNDKFKIDGKEYGLHNLFAVCNASNAGSHTYWMRKHCSQFQLQHGYLLTSLFIIHIYSIPFSRIHIDPRRLNIFSHRFSLLSLPTILGKKSGQNCYSNFFSVP